LENNLKGWHESHPFFCTFFLMSSLSKQKNINVILLILWGCVFHEIGIKFLFLQTRKNRVKKIVINYQTKPCENLSEYHLSLPALF